jgi:hypothetical protein
VTRHEPSTPASDPTAEHRRLHESRERTAHWKRWGPYVSDRAWGTVREDYSPHGTAWEAFPHDHARSRAYRWNEDGLAGICDRHQRICFGLALWNEHDPILKERLFGLTGNEGNHGEDVKEYYFHLDSTPTHSYMKFLYKYPQAAYPYTKLVEENRRRGRGQPEYELLDTGVFDDNRYFDVFVEYAKGDVEDILIRITATNRGPDRARLHVLPTIWFRNMWSWGRPGPRPLLAASPDASHSVVLDDPRDGRRRLYCDAGPELLFTENDTNAERLFGAASASPFVKDGFHEFVVHGRREAVNPDRVGTKAAARYATTIEPGASFTCRLRLTDRVFDPEDGAFGDHDDIFAARLAEADDFYATVIPASLSPGAQRVMRQAFAGLLWSKQYYHYVIDEWLAGDPAGPTPPRPRLTGRNHQWTHLHNEDVVSMPDKWEYPWYAAWDLAFHCVPLSLVDSEFAKEQLILLLREWYMHPNGQLPAYEWALDDVNPPVHAWAAWRVYKIEEKRTGTGDLAFLEKVFHKLLLNFTWWVNRKDQDGINIFEGGFLGLDNIGVFDRSQPLPTGGRLEQSDGTSWMAMYTLNMLTIALELARADAVYEDVATKFGEHFIYIVHAMNHIGHNGVQMWDEEDGFYYDVLHFPDCTHFPLKVRSMVGLIPLFAVESIEGEVLERLPSFVRRLSWFQEHRPALAAGCACMEPGPQGRMLLSIVNPSRLRRVLRVMLDEEEFLSPFGIRALSRVYRDHPYSLDIGGVLHTVGYEPAESTTGLFGGNSNWRGPIWLPVNYLIIESLQKFHHSLGDDYRVECPTGSGVMLTLGDVAAELSRRLSRLFLQGPDGGRAVYDGVTKFRQDPHWRELVLFHEYFHGDNGAGLGASHQTGWTALVAKLLQQSGE